MLWRWVFTGDTNVAMLQYQALSFTHDDHLTCRLMTRAMIPSTQQQQRQVNRERGR